MLTIKCCDKIFTPSKIICVGKNYRDHIKEMGGSDAPKEPAIFLKPNSAISFCPKEVLIPEKLGLLHHEVELCFMAGKRGRDIDLPQATSFICGYGVGIDFTLRARQALAKKAGGPWALAKGFDNSAVFGQFTPAFQIKDPCVLDISLSVNGEVRQKSNTKDMIFSPARILSFVSEFMTIEEGDIFMTGTPAGVGEVQDGDVIRAEISGLASVQFSVFRTAIRHCV